MIEIDNLHVFYHSAEGDVHAVRGIKLKVKQGQFYTLLGPSGCGKTTTLRALAGLEKPDQGEISIGDEVVFSSERGVAIPPYKRDIGMVFQSYAIWPHMDVFNNIAFPLQEMRGRFSKKEIREKVLKVLHLVQLDGLEDRPAPFLSGGQQQRLALARALVREPKVLLLDEPLSGTDPPQRLRFMEAMRGLVAQGRTIVISSHILEEVETLADRIILLTAGKVAATGEYRAIRQKLNERPYVVRVETDQPRVLGAGLMAIDAVVSVEVDEEGRLLVRSREVSELQRALPRVAHEKGVRVLRVEPLDDSLESVFEYLAQQQWTARG